MNKRNGITMRCDKGCMLGEQRCDHAARVILHFPWPAFFREHVNRTFHCAVELFCRAHHQEMIGLLYHDGIVGIDVPPVRLVVDGSQVHVCCDHGNADLFEHPCRLARDVLLHHFVHGAQSHGRGRSRDVREDPFAQPWGRSRARASRPRTACSRSGNPL